MEVEGLLCRQLSCACRWRAVDAGKPAPGKLQMGAHRLSWPGIVGASRAGRGASAAWAAPADYTRCAAEFWSMRTVGFRARDGILPRQRQSAGQADPDLRGLPGDRRFLAAERLVCSRS